MNVGTKKVTGMEAMSVLSLLIITAATFQFWFNHLVAAHQWNRFLK